MTVHELAVISRLESLHANKLACENLQERIAMLDSRLTGIKTASYEGEPVSGGGGAKGEDLKLDIIVERDFCKSDLEYSRAEVKQLEKALNKLTANERTVLDKFYIHKQNGYVRRLAEDLGYEEAQIYRIRKSAVNNLAAMLYGTRK